MCISKSILEKPLLTNPFWARVYYINQLSGYDVLTRHVVFCIMAGMTSVHVMHVSSYTVVDVMTVSNVNLYAVLATFLATSKCDMKVLIA
jgi:hypothetical protein